jgi:hypothetical protein
VARNVIDEGPFRFTEIHGPHRSLAEQFHVAALIRECGFLPPRCEFELEEVTLIDLIESALMEAYYARGDRAFDYEAWRAKGAPEAPLRAEFADSYDSARERRPEDTPLLDNLAALYAHGAEVEPLAAMRSDRDLSSGEKALLLFDGRHRTFAAAHAGVERLPVFVLLRADAVFSY